MSVFYQHARDFFNGSHLYAVFVSERYFARVARGKIDFAAYHIGRDFDLLAVFRYLENVCGGYRVAFKNLGGFNLD